MRGHIRQRGKNSYAIVLYMGRDADGKRRIKWHSLKGTRRQAETELTRLLGTIDGGEYIESSRMSVGQFLDYWLENYAEPKVSPKTCERYREMIKLHLKPALGEHRLQKLEPLHIQKFYTDSLREGRKDGKKGGLSAVSVLHHHRLLRNALQQAIRWNRLARNPADAVEPPRPEHQERQVLDEVQTAKLIEAARGRRILIAIIIAATTGLRRGEILALRWIDIDFENGTLAVRRSLEQTNAGLRFKPPKTKQGLRVVNLPNLAIEALRRHKAEQAKERLQLGQKFNDQGLVCARLHGTPMGPNEVTCEFAALIRSLDLPRITFHDLRHGHATQLLRAGVHPKVVSERLGHAKISITLDLYSHVLPSMQEDAAQRIDAVLRAAMNRKRP